MAVMADALAPPLIVSEDVFLALVRENPDLRLERSKRGELVVMPPTGYRGSERNVELVRQLANWNKQHRLGRVTESNGGYRLPDSAIRAPDAAWVSAERERDDPGKQTRVVCARLPGLRRRVVVAERRRQRDSREDGGVRRERRAAGLAARSVPPRR
jgi:hypothetical protein